MSNITATVRPAGIKCGNCKHYHVDVAAVKACHQGQPGVFTIEVTGATTRPAAPLATTGPLATQKQLNFLRKLCDERDTTLEHETNVQTLTLAGASQLISELLAKPKATQTIAAPKLVAPKVPAGRYAIDVDGVIKFFKVDCPTEGQWAGRTFVKIQASDDLHPVRGEAAKAVLILIAKDPKAASLRYGRELGHCGVCGRTLTDETSRANGIGPICADKAGW